MAAREQMRAIDNLTSAVGRQDKRMNQDALVTLAQQTLAICAVGGYNAPSGAHVRIALALATAVAGTVLHAPGDVPGRGRNRFSSTAITVHNETTLSALRRLSGSDGQVAALNFASARTPGGGFQRGAMAQEEALAYASGLYPCLAQVPAFYARNREFGSAIYLDLAIFSPRVPFFRDDYGILLEAPILASVISAAAPNARAIAEREPSAVGQVGLALQRRADLVLAVAVAHGIDRLVLGAWGCGVFGNDPRAVARIFADLLGPSGPYERAFGQVVFAVLDRSASLETFRAFEKALR
jgi:uncharacterized protein (TIGR02452 family)